MLKKGNVWHQESLTPVVGHVTLRRSTSRCIITARVTSVTSRVWQTLQQVREFPTGG